MRGPMMPDGKGGPGSRLREMTASQEKPANTMQTVSRIFSYWKEHWIGLVLMVLASIAEVGCSLASPLLMGRAIDECISSVSGKVDFENLNHILIMLIAVYILSSLLSWIQQYGMNVITLKIAKKIRVQMMDKIQTLSIKYFDENKRGDLMSRFTNDVDLMKSGLGDTFIQLFNTIFTLIGTIISMLTLSPLLTAISALTIPLVYMLSKLVGSKARTYFAAQQKALGDMNGLIVEGIGGIKVVRSFGIEDRQIKAFNEVNRRLESAGVWAQIWSGFLMPSMRVLENGVYIGVAVVGGILAYHATDGGSAEVMLMGISCGTITVGVIQSFLLYVKNFLRPVNMIASQYNAVLSAVAGAERIFRVLDARQDIVNAEGAKILKETEIKGEIKFDHVSFGYEPGKLVLKDISFEAHQDEVIAIVGSTGSGKTTIINLLTRFYEATSGSITIDGINIKDVTQESLRDQMGIVLQTPFLFSETVKYNVKYGWPIATDQEVEDATKAANAHNFVMRLPEGYDTMMLRGGENVSHGQKQLLTIARAILVETPILVFDEATSNIDTRTEILIQKAINNLTKGRTSFVIAHRLSTIQGADKILVLHEGRIVEQGKHEELLRNKGRYYEIYSSQFMGEEVDESGLNLN